MPESNELIEPKPDTLKTEGEKPVEKKEEAKPDPLAELEARLSAKFEKEIKERDDRIAALTKPVQPQGPTVVEKIDVYKDLGTKIWEDTPQALRTLRDEIKKEVTAELTGKYQAEKNEERFWDSVYRENKSFNRDEDHWVLQAVLNENVQSWQGYSIPKIKEELSKEATKRLARLEARKERKSDPSAPSLTLSSASPPQPRREAEPEKPKTLSQMIRERQQERQTALHKRLAERTRDDRGRYTSKELN